jgi:sigma-B regulation protein RsbU (phosphoserine phosphatase)
MKKLGSLRGKILYLCLGIVLAAIIGLAAVGLYEVNLLQQAIAESGQSESMAVKTASETLVWDMLYDVILGDIDTVARGTEGEFWTMEHDFKMLGIQVQDVIEHPEKYAEVDIAPPDKSNDGKFVPQLLFPSVADGADEADEDDEDEDEDFEESIILARKLANLAPVMEEIIVGNARFTNDCYISLPNGVSIAVDDMSSSKLNEDGSVKEYDARTREWYQGAVAKKGFYFSSVVDSYFHDTQGIGFGMPVYVDDELVAVLHGFTSLDTLKEITSRLLVVDSDFSILISSDGKLISSPRTTGELSMDANKSRDMRHTDNEELNEMIKAGINQEFGYEEVVIDGQHYYACFAPISVLGWTQILFVSKAGLEAVPDDLLLQMDDARNLVFTSYKASFTRTYIVIVLVMVALIAGAAVLASFFSKMLVTPVNTMTERVKDMTGDNMDFEMEPIYRTGDEIEILAGSFSDMTKMLRNYISEITVMSAEKERLDTEMATASRIQSSMLPRKFPDRHEFDLFADMITAKEVGGDLYDFYFIDDDHLVLVIGDVSGKGVTAALFMAMAKHVIKSEILLKDGDVLAAIKSVNDALCEENEARMFITLWLGVLTLSTGHLTYVNAGHEYPIIYRSGGEFEKYRDNHAMPAACMKGIEIKTNELDLHKGDTLYLYTDGITEACTEGRKMFGRKKLIEVLNQNKDADMKTLDEAVRAEIKNFVGDAEQYDDMTTLCFRYNGTDQ